MAINSIRTNHLPKEINMGEIRAEKTDKQKQDLLFSDVYGFNSCDDIRTVIANNFSALKKLRDSKPRSQSPTGTLPEVRFDLLNQPEAKRLFEFTNGVPIGIWFSEKVYDLNDPFVQNAPIRKYVSRMLLESAHEDNVIWRERAGIVHIGGQISTFVPIASLPPANFGAFIGFAPNSLLKYRTLIPEVASDNEAMHAHHDNFLHLPLTPQLAAQMNPGCEVELSGQANLTFASGLVLVLGELVGPALIGAAVHASSAITGAKEVGIRVLALSQKGHVRVTLRNLQKGDSSFSLGAVAGLLYQITGSWASHIGGNFKLLPTSTITNGFVNSIGGITTASMGIFQSHANTTADIASFELNLNVESGREIYRKLLLLQVRKALALAKKSPNCARVAYAKENIEANMFSASAETMGRPIAAETLVSRNTTGEFSFATGETIYSQENSLARHSMIKGLKNRSVSWQEVFIKDHTGQNHPYFRLQYRDTDFHYSKKRFQHFLRFANGLNLSDAQIQAGALNEQVATEKRLSKCSEVETNFDFFFTRTGIENLSQKSTAEIERAYVQASQAIDSAYDGSPILDDSLKGNLARDLIGKFESYLKNHRFDILKISPAVFSYHRKYKSITGRSLSIDYGLFDQARNFAKLIKNSKSETDESCGGIFIQLARRKSFDIAQTIATLVNLLGRSEVRIHSFSLKGAGGIRLELPPENKLVHPEERFSEHLLAETFVQ